ncbi:NAD-dependent succinate-semialdehyde dehydrogenase [Haloarchaeobius sp. DFWS5]|uniref:NAD-dependent succinate-semialdehyde dehydrogenase n=1 Tax=Haloarchaeobius sp. DFWS5 TaxID=3446114 RepID=UPI003EB6CEED
MDRVNPATGEQLGTVEEHTDDEVDRALERATATFDSWRDVPMTERRQLLRDAADVLRENEDEYARLMTEEMGKPISQGRAEVEKCAWLCEHYAEKAPEYLQDKTIGAAEQADTYVTYQPLGPVLAVMPWNFPLWQVFRFAAPNLVAGNVGLLKHASNVPECAMVIEDVFLEAGFPVGAFQTLLIGGSRAEEVIRDDRIKAVALTGSEFAGKKVAATAGEELKKTVLELGGSDPFVVLDDADVGPTAEKAAHARLQNSGQSCIAAKRFIVHDDVYDEFLEAFMAEMESWTVGDPMEEDTEVGPQAREDLMEDLHEQVQSTIDAGATCAMGGEPLDREGYYYPPTILTDVPRDAAAACEETFGPVAAVFRVDSEEEAVELANDTDYGLGASVWTSDLERGDKVARQLAAGCAYVNQLVKSDPRLPFGGVKMSGYGRELAGEGIREFVNRKTVWVQEPDPEAGSRAEGE